MPKVSAEHREAMRRRIQAAALACVRRQGLSKLTMNDIIRESGLSAGAIYGYYASKDDLVAAMAEELIGSRFDQLDEYEQRSPMPHPLEAIVAVVDTVPAGLAEDGVIIQLWGMAPVEPEIAEVARGWVQRFTTRVSVYVAAWLRQEGLPPEAARERADVIAPALLGLAQGYFIRGALAGASELPAYRQALLALAPLLHP